MICLRNLEEHAWLFRGLCMCPLLAINRRPCLIVGGPLSHMQCAAGVPTNTVCQPSHTQRMLVFRSCMKKQRHPRTDSLYNNAALQDKVVNPRMRWIHQKKEQMAAALELPDVDVSASEAAGRRRVPPIQTASIPVQPQPPQELNKTER